MASFSQTIIGKYGVKTCQETKNTYDWILKVIRQIDADIDEISASFSFDIGQIACSCNSIEEYVENAYGASEYSLTNITMAAYNSKRQLACFLIDFQNKIRISTASKSKLEEIVQALNSTELGESETNASLDGSKKSSTIIINGNSNTIANDSSAVINTQSKGHSESKFKQTLTAIWQNLLSNWIWYLLCLGVGALVSKVI